MVRKKTIRIISFLIIIIFALQLVPYELDHADGFQMHTQNSRAVFIPTAVHSDVFIESRSSLKAPFLKVPAKHTSYDMLNVLIAGISYNDSTYQDILFDCRKGIKQTIPQHFHGGKYKPANLYT